MKICTTIILSLVIIMFLSCNEKNKNPVTKSYFFTNEEIDLLYYNETDSFKMIADGFDTIKYYVLEKKIYMVSDSETEEHEEAYIRFKRTFSGIDTLLEKGYISMNKKNGIFEYCVSLDFTMDNINALPVTKLSEHYESKVINEKLYNNVYRIEKDTSLNSENDCFIKRAYISPEKGIIQYTAFCHTFDLTEF